MLLLVLCCGDPATCVVDPGLNQRDPRWVGAWWLGFVICACCSIVWAIPMSMFPAKTLNSSAPEEDGKGRHDKEENQNTKENLKGDSSLE